MMKNNKNSLGSKLMYGCGDIFGGGAFLLISLLFLNYLTDVELMSPALAGGIIMIGKVWDAISDPLMGFLSDRTQSKFGRRKIYFLLGIMPVFLSFTALWFSFGISSATGLFVYYTFMYLLFNTSFTMVMIPYNSILPEMVTEYGDRTSYTGVRMIFSICSAIAAGVLPMMIINRFGVDIKKGYLIMALIFASIYAVVWLIVYFGTWESQKAPESDRSSSVWGELKTVFRNKSFRIHSGIFICGQAAVDFLTTIFIYYLTACLHRPKEFSLVLGTLLITQLIVMPLHMYISKKFKKTTPYKIGFTVWGVALLTSLFLTPESSVVWVYLVAAMSGFGTSAAVLVPWSILPDISDVDQMITGRRREGVYSGMATLLRKIANGISIGLIGVLLQMIGYARPERAGEIIIQSAGTILGIKLLFGVVPLFCILLAALFSLKYTMTEEKHGILMNEVRRRINGGKSENADQNTKAICEELTGVSYHELWAIQKEKKIQKSTDIPM